ncbi:hypothetical protein Mapa_015065 [Marchantia paleacea]|nr:hypothetical protein Mapa_015065 [Marchantia paleacea]
MLDRALPRGCSVRTLDAELRLFPGEIHSALRSLSRGAHQFQKLRAAVHVAPVSELPARRPLHHVGQPHPLRHGDPLAHLEEPGDDVEHGRAPQTGATDASGSDGGQEPESFGVLRLEFQLTVVDAVGFALLDEGQSPVDDARGLVAHIDGPPAAEQLEQQNAEAEDVHLRAEAGRGVVLGLDVAHGTHGLHRPSGSSSRVVHIAPERQAEASQLRVPLAVDHHVGALHIPVNYGGAGRVQRQEGFRHLQSHVHPHRPAQGLRAVMQHVVQGSVGHVLHHQELLVGVGAPAESQ